MRYRPGLDGPLRGRAQAAVHALRLRANPVVSVDLRNHDAARTWSQGYCDN